MSNTGANPSVNKLFLAWEAATTTFIRAPLWALYALPSINRPRSAWSLERTLRIRLLQYKPYIVAKTGMWWRDPDYLAIEQGPKVKGFWISPAPDLIVGDVKQWAVNADLESIRIPGYWLEKEGLDLPVNSPPRPGEKVIYAIHGGGFARQSASPNDSTSNIPRGILKHTSTDVIRALTVEYRLTKHRSMKPYNPFPAGLIDVIAGYNHLVNVVGFAPEDIIVEGDSAGGNLALALVRHLIDNQGHAGAQIPRPPGALILCSPWVDLAPATRNIEAAVQYNIPSDFVSVANRGTNSLIATYCGSLGPSAAATNSYLSPATFSSRTNVSFKGYPRTFILAGGAEVLLDSIRLLRQGMTRDIGADQVTYVEKPLAVHDFLTLMWHEPERTECLKLIAQWIEPGAKAIQATQSGSGSQTKSLKLKSKL